MFACAKLISLVFTTFLIIQNTNVYSLSRIPEDLLRSREIQKNRISGIIANLTFLTNKIPRLQWDTFDENLDIEQYMVISNTFLESINNLKNFIIDYKNIKEEKIELYKEKLDKYIKKFNIIIANIRSNCDNYDCSNQCKVYKPNEIFYISTYDLFAQIMLFDFRNNITLLDNQINYLKLNINKTKGFLNFNRTNIFLKKPNNDFHIIKGNSLKNFFKIKEKIWNIIYILMENMINFGKYVDEIGEGINMELKYQITSFACCSKMFDLNLTNFVCKEPEYYLKQYENSKLIKYVSLPEISSAEDEEEDFDDS